MRNLNTSLARERLACIAEHRIVDFSRGAQPKNSSAYFRVECQSAFEAILAPVVEIHGGSGIVGCRQGDTCAGTDLKCDLRLCRCREKSSDGENSNDPSQHAVCHAHKSLLEMFKNS